MGQGDSASTVVVAGRRSFSFYNIRVHELGELYDLVFFFFFKIFYSRFVRNRIARTRRTTTTARPLNFFFYCVPSATCSRTIRIRSSVSVGRIRRTRQKRLGIPTSVVLPVNQKKKTWRRVLAYTATRPEIVENSWRFVFETYKYSGFRTEKKPLIVKGISENDVAQRLRKWKNKNGDYFSLKRDSNKTLPTKPRLSNSNKTSVYGQNALLHARVWVHVKSSARLLSRIIRERRTFGRLFRNNVCENWSRSL